MDVNNLITQIVFDGAKSYIITKDKLLMERLRLDFKGKAEGDKIIVDVSSCNILVITENKKTKQGLYFQLNTQEPESEKQTVKPKTTVEPEPKADKNMPVKRTETAHKSDKTESLHHKPQEVKTVIMRMKQKPQEKDLWSED